MWTRPPVNQEKGVSKWGINGSRKALNGRLELGWTSYSRLPPCPKADLGTSTLLLSPKRGIRSETRALLQSRSSTAPGHASHRTLFLPSEGHPLCLLALPHLDTYTTTVSTLEGQNTVQYCARVPVRSKTALRSPSWKHQQLQIQSA